MEADVLASQAAETRLFISLALVVEAIIENITVGHLIKRLLKGMTVALEKDKGVKLAL